MVGTLIALYIFQKSIVDQVFYSVINCRSFLNLLLSGILFLLLPASAFAQFEGGDGSADNPWQVATAQQLNDIRNDLAAHYILTADIDLSAATRLGGAFANAGAGWDPIGSNPAPFTGSLDGNGCMGMRCKITGLFINRVSFSDGDSRVGLFRIINAGAELTGLALENVDVTGANQVGGLVGALGNDTSITDSYVTGSVRGDERVGGLTGSAYGGSIIANSFSIVSVASTSSSTSVTGFGGLTGSSSGGAITNSYATGSVSGGSDVGGLVGFLQAFSGTVTNSYALGSVSGSTNVGGLVGRTLNGGSASDSYWNTDTTGQDRPIGSSASIFGGLSTAQMRQQATFTGFDFNAVWQIQEQLAFPVLQGNLQEPPPGKLPAPQDAPTPSTPAEAATSVPRQPLLTWAAGSVDAEALTASYDVQISVNSDFSAPVVDVTGITATQFSPGIDLERLTEYYWRVRAVNLAGESAWSQASFTTTIFAGGAGTVADPWQVATAEQLNDIRNNLSAHYILTADIDLTTATGDASGAFWNDGKGWEPIATSTFFNEFRGSLRGDGFKITGLYINRPSESDIGLFAATRDASLNGLALEDVDIDGDLRVGGLVGQTTGSGNRIENSYVTGNVAGSETVGGLAGAASGTLDNSYANVTVMGDRSNVGGLIGDVNSRGDSISNSYATGNVSGAESVGGLIGGNSGSISDSYATGDVSGSASFIGGLVGGQGVGSTSSSYATGNVSGDSSVGGLIGSASQSTGSVNDSYATGNVAGNSQVGGLVGRVAASSVNNSYATGSVSVSDGGAGTDIGGLVGRSAVGATITNSYWNAETSGQDSSAGGTGLTSAQMRDPDSFTGLDFADTWQIQQGFSFPVLQAATQSPAPGLVVPDSPVLSSPVNQATGIVRQPVLDWTAASPESAASTASYDVQVSPDAGFSAPIIDQTGITDTQYAVTTDLDAGTAYYWRVRAVNTAGASDWTQTTFTTVPFTEGTGTEASPWQIATAGQLDAIRNQLSAHFILAANIDLAPVTGDASGVLWNEGKGWQPIGDNSNRFTGSLDGNGFTISGLHINRADEDYVGLFGYVAGASITGVAIEGGSVSGGSNVGALAGILAQDSVLTDNHANANVSGTGSRIGGLVGNNSWGTITDSHATGNVDGGDTYIGGLAGSNDWEIFDSYATGNVTGNTRVGGLVGESSYIVRRSYATGDVTATVDLVGGLVGDNLWKVDDSYATGRVVGVENVGGLTGRTQGGDVNTSYATGSVTGDSHVGGLVGIIVNSDVTTSYWNTETSGQDSSAGSDDTVGLTSAEMRQQASFSGFDFDTVWQIDEGVTFPVLRSNTQNPPPGALVVTPAPPPATSPPVITGESQGGVFEGNVNINPGGVLNGGQITGTVQNNGEIQGDVILGANTTINGGTVSGNISGNQNQPAVINGARITSGANLNNVVIGNDTVLDPDVQLGPNVKFASSSAIPPGIDLTGAMPSRSWAGGDGRSVPDLSGDVITPVDGITPDSTVDAIRVPAGFEQGQSRQDSDTGELTIISGNVRATMLPGRVRQASPDQEPGVFISDDGDVVLVTANGREITSQPVVANRERFSNVLGELGLESQFGDNANLRLTNPDTGTDNPGFLSVRPEVLSFPATGAEEEGLSFRPVPGLNGATVAVMVYRDEDGNLMQQDLVPVPSDWQSLKSNLTSIEGLSEVRIDTQGIISVSVDGQPVRGQMQYEVTQGGFDDDVPAEGSVLISAGDVNGDGSEDFRVVYADGSSQLMLIFSNAL